MLIVIHFLMVFTEFLQNFHFEGIKKLRKQGSNLRQHD